jgi:hypothetical protein
MRRITATCGTDVMVAMATYDRMRRPCLRGLHCVALQFSTGFLKDTAGVFAEPKPRMGAGSHRFERGRIV